MPIRINEQMSVASGLKKSRSGGINRLGGSACDGGHSSFPVEGACRSAVFCWLNYEVYQITPYRLSDVRE